MESLLALLFAFPLCHGHMSMQFPHPRDKKNGGTYAKWQANEPMIGVHPKVCHGLDRDTTVRTANQLTAGQTITIDIYGSVPHGGGHCTFWYSTDDETFTKIIDIKDCTLMSEVTVTLPETMPTDCKERCTFAFSWVPALSGACEIYMNCADISVSGANGGNTNPITKNFKTEIIDQGSTNSYGCQRVNTISHWTNIFMPLKTTYGDTGSDANSGTGSSDSTPSPTIHYTPYPTAPVTPSPTVSQSSSDASGNGILITNRPASTAWWYSVELTDIPNGIEIEAVFMKHASSTSWEQGANQLWSASSVWSFHENAPFDGPFDFKMRSTSGLEIESEDVLEDYTPGKSGRMSQSFDSAFSFEEGSDLSNPIERVLTWILVFVMAWCAVCVAAAFCMRKRQKRQSLSEMEKMSTAVDETNEMNEIEISVIDAAESGDETVRAITTQ